MIEYAAAFGALNIFKFLYSQLQVFPPEILKAAIIGGNPEIIQLLEEKVKEKVAIRLIHAKEPGTNFRADFDKYPLLWTGVERVLCPRVHFKILVFDMQSVYIGSANMTGAAFGMKSTKTRNFEAGIFTEVPELVESAVEQFDEVWMGKHCKECGRKLFCGDRVV